MTATIEDAILGETLSDEATPLMAKPLNQYRKQRYMTVREFAAYLGIAQDTYFRIISGETQARPSTIKKIAKRLNVKPQDISEFIIPDDEVTGTEAH